ncbi:MAG: hotdog fold thioesterase [Chloroflexi bacterium]|nr:hotdog fold thioesterase [Chloroflexota bacterium]
MTIWRTTPTLEALNRMSAGSAVSHLGIEFIEVGDDYLIAQMPVDQRTRQPMGLLHGGASALLAETLGSVATYLIISLGQQSGVGIELNISHLRAVRQGTVQGRVQPIRLGRRTHVWDVRISDEAGKLVAVARLTMAILSHE